MSIRRELCVSTIMAGILLFGAASAACGGKDERPAGTPSDMSGGGMDHSKMDGGMDHPTTDGGVHH